MQSISFYNDPFRTMPSINEDSAKNQNTDNKSLSKIQFIDDNPNKRSRVYPDDQYSRNEQTLINIPKISETDIVQRRQIKI